MTPRLIVVRHSERLDEIDELSWKKMVRKQSAEGGRKSFVNDPIISPTRGAQIASEMALTVSNIISQSATQGLIVRLYASRLLRAAQTASFIGQALNIPVHVSAGLAQIIPAVKNKQGTFEFATVEELSHYCQSVEFVDCDKVRSSDYLPTNSWRAALDIILAKSEQNVINIVVAHRETVRKLAGEYLQTPYCCLGLFNVRHCPQSSEENLTSSHEALPPATKVITRETISGARDVRDSESKNVQKEMKSGTSESKAPRISNRIMSSQTELKSSVKGHPRTVVGSHTTVSKLNHYVDSIKFVTILDRDGTEVPQKGR